MGAVTGPESDFDLLSRWRGGDSHAGEMLFERHFETVYRFFRNKVGEGVDDLLQSTFLACVEGRDRFRENASFRTYLFQIARFQLYAHYRKRKRNESLDFTSTSVAALGTTPTGVLARRQAQRSLLTALRRLPMDMQIALELCYWEELTQPEVADVLGIPQGTVASRLRRARDQLAQLLREDGTLPVGELNNVDDLDKWARSLRDILGPTGC